LIHAGSFLAASAARDNPSAMSVKGATNVSLVRKALKENAATR
jgi:hypothetical protein